MELKLRNIKGTKDYMPEEQYGRNEIRKKIESVFECYGYLPLETPILCYYDMLASKYAGGSEILKEVYKLKDQGDRDLGFRYDLTIPFAKVIGLNPDIRMPFKRYEIGKVFRDGPVKLGRNREFIQCDVDVVGVKSMLAEAELISMVFEVFDKLQLEVYVSFNNRKLLSGIISNSKVSDEMINEVILTVDKMDKIGLIGVKQELIDKGLSETTINSLFESMQSAKSDLQAYMDSNLSNQLISEGGRELNELNSYFEALGIIKQVRFNPFLARGLDIYTSTVFEAFMVDGSITSSVAGGGRYDNIIGSFLDNGKEYRAVGISFGLDVIFAALTLKNKIQYKYPLDLMIIPLGTESKTLEIAKVLRQKGFHVDIEMTGRKLKKCLDFANKEKIPYVLILGQDELATSCIKLKSMFTGLEKTILISSIAEELIMLDQPKYEIIKDLERVCGIH
jgi:histidyl-tRNA synthetase